MTAANGRSAASVGGIAARLGLSKSGVFALFGSKDALDLAVIDAARASFARDVETAAESAPRGVARLSALVEGWLSEAGAQTPPLAVLRQCEPGPSRPAQAAAQAWHRAWRQRLQGEVAAAVALGELAAATDPVQAAFEIDALLVAAAHGAATGERSAIAAGRRGVENRLRQLAAER